MSNLKEHREPTLGIEDIVKSAGYVAGAGVAATVGGVVALGTTGCRCGGGSSSSGDDFNYEAWAQTDGAAGRINMEAVQEAIEQASSPTDFEDRVNNIYEGDGVILVRVYNSGQNQLVEGWEDLDENGQITDAADDKLFTLTRGPGNTTRLDGHGANSYYSRTYPPGYSPMGGFFTGFLVANMMRPGWGGYYTPMGRRTVIMTNRSAFRRSPAFAQARARNSAFMANQRATNPRFAASGSRVSPARQSFRGRVRSSGGSFGRSGRVGGSGFRGGGR